MIDAFYVFTDTLQLNNYSFRVLVCVGLFRPASGLSLPLPPPGALRPGWGLGHGVDKAHPIRERRGVSFTF